MTMSRSTKREVIRDHNRASMEAIGLIRKIMARKGITQSELARRLGFSRQNVFAMLSGQRRISLRSIVRFAHAVGARVSFSVSLRR